MYDRTDDMIEKGSQLESPVKTVKADSEWITSKNDLNSRPPRNQMSDLEMIRQLRREGLIGGYIRTQPLRKTRNGNISFYVPLHIAEGETRHQAACKPPRILQQLETNRQSEKAFKHIQERLEKALRRREEKLHFIEKRARSNRTRSKEALSRTEWRRAEIRRRQRETHDQAMRLAEENAQRESHEQITRPPDEGDPQ